MTTKGSKKLPPRGGNPPPLQGLNQELADAFSNAVFSLLEHNCSCPSAEFVRLLVKNRKEMFKGGETIAQSYDITQD